MKIRWTVALAAFVALFMDSVIIAQSQGIMGGFKGNKRGTGAVELLLATGILAKLLNHRAKHGASMAGRHLLHALIGPRYPGPHPRYPLEMSQIGAHPLLQDDLLEQHASMSALSLNDADLMLNQESALLASRAPLLMSPSMLTDSSALLAEAQLGQQLLAARKARKILEAKKLLAAQEASSFLAAQSEAAHYLAAHDGFHSHSFLADQSRQVYSSLPPPKNMPQRRPNSGQQIGFPAGSGHASNGFVGSNIPPQYQAMQGQQGSGQQTGNHGNTGYQNNYQGNAGHQNFHGNPGLQNNYNGNSGLQGNFQGNSGLQGNFQGNSGLQGNFQGNSIPQANYQSNSIPQSSYQSNSVPQGSYQSNSGSQGYQGGNQGQADQLGSESTQHFHSVPFRPHNYGSQGYYRGHSGQGMNNFMPPDETRHLQRTVARADDVLTIPPGFDDDDAAQIIAGLV